MSSPSATQYAYYVSTRSVYWDFPSDELESAPSAVKTLRVLEMVASVRECALSDLVSATGLSKSTTLRLLALLIAEGYLERAAHGRYRAALKMWRLGCGAVRYENVREHVLPILHELVEETAETAHYAVYEDGRATYVEKVDGSHPIRSYTSVGSSSPAYATATGKALLAWQGEAEIRRVVDGAERHTAASVVSCEEFSRAAETIRQSGYAVNRGEWRDGVWGIAAPIFDHRQEVIGALGVSGPADRIEALVPLHARTVVDAAARVSAQHGYEPLTNAGAS